MKVFVLLLSVFALTLGNIIPRISDRIYGGHPTTIEKHPHQVELLNEGWHSCGGSIVNKDTIVTAAHCVHGNNHNLITVKVGSTYLNAGQEYEIAEIIVHPEYNVSAEYNNDAAVIKLSKPLTFSDKVRPIKLQPAGIPVPEGTTVQATGWGHTMVNCKGYATQLQEVDLVVLPNEKCRLLCNKGNYKITNSMLCTHSPGKGILRGDSGGPLIFNNTLIGVTSWGSYFSTGDPDVFARMSVLNGFITKNL